MSEAGTQVKHTPGPWLITKCGHDFAICADEERAFDLATVHNGGNVEQLKANARIIASAPDAHRIIRMLHSFMNDGGGRISFSTLMDDADETLGEAIGSYLAGAEREHLPTPAKAKES